jgi:hypothetical protein
MKLDLLEGQSYKTSSHNSKANKCIAERKWMNKVGFLRFSNSDGNPCKIRNRLFSVLISFAKKTFPWGIKESLAKRQQMMVCRKNNRRIIFQMEEAIKKFF